MWNVNNCGVRLLIVLFSLLLQEKRLQKCHTSTLICIYQTENCFRRWTVTASKCIKHLLPHGQSVKREEICIGNIFVLGTRIGAEQNMRQSTFWLIIKLAMKATTSIKSFFFLSCRDRPFLSIYFPFMHERQYAWQQMNLSTRHKCVCGMGLGVCHEIKWLRLELFVLIAFLVRHSKCESKLTWARHQSVQPHNHQRIPASTIWSHSLTISSFLLWALNTWSAFIFFSSEKKNCLFSGHQKINFLHWPGMNQKGLHSIIIIFISCASAMISIRIQCRRKKNSMDEREEKTKQVWVMKKHADCQMSPRRN